MEAPEVSSALSRPISEVILNEQMQAPVLRQQLYAQLDEILGQTCVFFGTDDTSMIDPNDADAIESVIRFLAPENGLCLILMSNGGDGLAAERIIHICRHYSQNNFSVMVPTRAKSAATMIALGAQKILMAPNAELGPIDPQVTMTGGGQLPASAIIDSYDNLLEASKNLTAAERVEGHLHQLNQYNAVEVEWLRKQVDLAKDIALRSLSTGMMEASTAEQLNACVAAFGDWGNTLSHGRAMFPDRLIELGLNVEVLDRDSEATALALEIATRARAYLQASAAKTIESASYVVGAAKQ